VSAGVTLPFRTHGAALALGADDATAITVRVQLPELWETIAVRCGSAVSVAALTRRRSRHSDSGSTRRTST